MKQTGSVILGPSRSHRVTQLDFVRGIAILSVIEYHVVTVPIENIWARGFEYFFKRVGWMGVDLFFVLSGFLIGGLLIQEFIATGDILIRRFLVRRMFKIWPAYYLFIIFQLCAGRHPWSTFAWQNILNIQNYAGTSLAHTWSLAVEEHFYLLLPLLLITLLKSDRLRPWIGSVLGACCLLILCGRIISVYGLHASNPQWQTHARMDALLFGVILSYGFYMHYETFRKLLKLRLLLLLLTVLGLIFGLREGLDSRLMWSIGYTLNYISLGGLLLLVYGYRGILSKTLLYRAIAKIGLYSYGIYLWHYAVRDPLARVARHYPPGLKWGLLLISQYLAAIVLGIVLTKAVESPILRLRDRLIPRGPAKAPSGSAYAPI